MWDGEPELLIDSLVDARLIDQKDDGLFIDDWDDYARRLIDKRQQNAERMRNARAQKKTERVSPVPRTFDARAGATVPNQTEPKDEEIVNQQIPVTRQEPKAPEAQQNSSLSSGELDIGLAQVARAY